MRILALFLALSLAGCQDNVCVCVCDSPVQPEIDLHLGEIQ